MITAHRGPRSSRSPRLGVALGAAIAMMSLAITGCVAGDAEPVATATAASPTPSAVTPSPTPTSDPLLVKGGTAGQNRPYLEFVVGQLLQSTPQPTSVAIVDSLVAAGFERAAMQVTADTTRVGDPADSILFSVLIDRQCLLGQVAQGTVATEVADVLGTGECLVGRTLSLD